MSTLTQICSTAQGIAAQQGLTPVEYLQTFPNPCTIPPACFYNAQGLANWLNNNPTYKDAFSYTRTFRFLFPPQFSAYFSTLGIPNYSTVNVPLCSNVQTLSQNQALKYNQQLKLFQTVYSTNSNAYINYLTTGQAPIYYTYSSFHEKYELNSAVALVNKLYPFNDMAEAVGWQVPFPL
jgi:hypothetical protein